jgi:hypothetical protein
MLVADHLEQDRYCVLMPTLAPVREGQGVCNGASLTPASADTPPTAHLGPARVQHERDVRGGNYADFGDIPGVVPNDWPDFEDLLDSQEWVKSRFGEMEKSRNVIAHNSVLEDAEIERIRIYHQDRTRIVGL